MFLEESDHETCQQHCMSMYKRMSHKDDPHNPDSLGTSVIQKNTEDFEFCMYYTVHQYLRVFLF